MNVDSVLVRSTRFGPGTSSCCWRRYRNGPPSTVKRPRSQRTPQLPFWRPRKRQISSERPGGLGQLAPPVLATTRVTIVEHRWYFYKAPALFCFNTLPSALFHAKSSKIRGFTTTAARAVSGNEV